jgi:hypothetical protein
MPLARWKEIPVGVIEIAARARRRRPPKDRRMSRRRLAGGIITNLLLQADFYNIALRYFGLLLAALASARLATAFD